MTFVEEQQEKAIQKLTRDCNLAYPSGSIEFCSLREIVSDVIKATAEEIRKEGSNCEGDTETHIQLHRAAMLKCAELILMAKGVGDGWE